MDNLSQLFSIFGAGGVPEFRDVQLCLDFFGVEIDEMEQNDHPSYTDENNFWFYKMKFSVPESYEIGILGEDNTDVVTSNEVAKAFKEAFQNALMGLWSKNNEYDDAFKEEALQSIVFMCRVRKGEIWTVADKDRKIAETSTQVKAIEAYLKQRNEYTEV